MTAALTRPRRAPIPEPDALDEARSLVAWLRHAGAEVEVCDRLEAALDDLAGNLAAAELELEEAGEAAADVHKLEDRIDDARYYLEQARAALVDDLGDEVVDVLCADCRGNVFDIDAAGRHEYYSVHDALWKAAAGADESVVLCLGCLEARLGRELTAADFTAAPVNAPSPLDTARLAERKRRRPTSDLTTKEAYL